MVSYSNFLCAIARGFMKTENGISKTSHNDLKNIGYFYPVLKFVTYYYLDLEKHFKKPKNKNKRCD